jgi:hypothetical protein
MNAPRSILGNARGWLSGALATCVLGLPVRVLAQQPAPPPTPEAAPIAPAAAAPAAESPAPTTGSDPAPASVEAAAPEPPVEDDAAAAAGWGDLTTLSEQEQEETPVFRAKLYGFIDTRLEKQAKSPAGVDAGGNTVYERSPYEFSIPNLHVMVQGALYEKYKFFLNLAGPGAGDNTTDVPVAVRNAWMEAPVLGRYLLVRAGKTYRRFGLYNEILDAVPTFIGIEPPEIFDNDHLMLTRTTNLMLHGSTDVKSAVLNYSLTTGNDERLPKSVPIGGDVNVELPYGVKLGTSFYFSGGPAGPSRAVGEGSPRGGVVNWMSEDTYRVLGAYAQLKRAGFILQAEYWRAHHNARRDGDALATLFESGSLNPAQTARLFANGDPTSPNTKAVYDVQTFYFRGGYEIPFGTLSSLTPYVQMDYYENPEVVNKKSLGGDAEAGATDDGKFQKYTAGLVFRPVPQVALKADGSAHVFKFNGTTEWYPEIRSSFSYLWELAQ